MLNVYTYDMTRAYLLAHALINPLKLKQIIYRDFDTVNIRVHVFALLNANVK